MRMDTNRTPFLITAALLAATLTLALPDLRLEPELDKAGEETTMHGVSSARRAPAAADTKP
jgi:hypothetical protein